MRSDRTMLALATLSGLALSACTLGGRPPDRAAGALSPIAPSPTVTAPDALPPGPMPSGTAAPSSAPSSSPAAAPPTSTGMVVASDRCRTAQLKVDGGRVQAAGSARTLVLGLTNVSSTRCTITGFGGLALLDADGTKLPTRFERSPAQPRTVELAPQGFTTRTINWRVVPARDTDPTTDCVSGYALLVTPPDEQPANLVVNEPVTACQGGTITGTPWDRDAG